MIWREDAACIGKPIEWFFPTDEHAAGRFYKMGREVCAGCPVRSECIDEHAKAEAELQRVLPGLWAGTTGRDRQERRPRLAERKSTPRTCVVCGATFPDRGKGIVPRYCPGKASPCSQRAQYRRSIGAPVSDAEFAVWRAEAI